MESLEAMACDLQGITELTETLAQIKWPVMLTSAGKEVIAQSVSMMDDVIQAGLLSAHSKMKADHDQQLEATFSLTPSDAEVDYSDLRPGIDFDPVKEPHKLPKDHPDYCPF